MRALGLSFAALICFSFAQRNVDWFGMLGKTIEDREVYGVISEYGEYTSQLFREDLETQLNWEKNGVAITTNDQSVVKKIYFFNDQYTLGSYTFARFGGNLPLGLSLNMTPKKMKDVLGKPTKEEGDFYKKLTYVTNYNYEILFKDNVVQYVRIGVLKQPSGTSTQGQ